MRKFFDVSGTEVFPEQGDIADFAVDLEADDNGELISFVRYDRVWNDVTESADPLVDTVRHLTLTVPPNGPDAKTNG